MNNRQRNLLIAIVFLMGLGTATYFLVVLTRDRKGVTRVFEPGRDTPADTLRSIQRQNRMILTDFKTRTRTRHNQTFINPMVFTPDELVLRYTGSNPNDNPWIAFRYFYDRYYSLFYRRRYGVDLTTESPEVQIAYGIWKRKQQAPESRSGR
ncbi:MAG: hypothetical protein ABEJ65_05520 [bacterium]